MEAWPGQVANVMLTSVRMLADSGDNQAHITVLQDGKWDAAFALCEDPAVRFDFAGSPFGVGSFDRWPLPNDHTYADRFAGFVFLRPVSGHRMSQGGVPGLIDDGTAAELARRLQVMHGPATTTDAIASMIDDRRRPKEFDYGDRSVFTRSEFTECVAKWLPPASRRP